MSEWIDTTDICEFCGYNGKHLSVDGGELLYCGRCNNEVE